LGIKNPQIIHDSVSEQLYFLYYYDEALYVRLFNESDLIPQDDLILYPDEAGKAEDGSFVADPRISLALSVSNNAPNRPVFLVGKINDKMATAIAERDQNLAVIMPYPIVDQKGASLF
jgi:hypothetical protein